MLQLAEIRGQKCPVFSSLGPVFGGVVGVFGAELWDGAVQQELRRSGLGIATTFKATTRLRKIEDSTEGRELSFFE